MRRKKSRAVQRFIQAALACTCLSLVPFSGCSSNSSKSFSLGLRKEAARTAQQAEKELAERKKQEAAAKKSPEQEGSARLATRDDERKSPLADLLRNDTKSSSDPFARTADGVVKAPEAAPPKTEQGRAAVAATQTPPKRPGTSPPKSGGAGSPWDDLMKEYGLEDQAGRPDPAKVAQADSKPATGTAAKSPTTAATTAVPRTEAPAWAQGRTQVAAAKTPTAGNRVVGPEPPADVATPDWAQTRAAQSKSPVTESAPPAANEGIARLTREDLRSAVTEPGTAKIAEPAVEVAAQAIVPASSKQPETKAVARAEATGSGSSRAAKIRVQALLSQAHSEMVRGDWFSAYRSALLAEQEAKSRSVQFAQHEERPDQLVRDMATRLWGNPNARPDLSQGRPDTAVASRTTGSGAKAVSQATTLPKAQPSPTVTAHHSGDVFGATSSSEWVSVNDQGGFQSAQEVTPAAGSVDPWSHGALPEVKPIRVRTEEAAAPESAPAPVLPNRQTSAQWGTSPAIVVAQAATVHPVESGLQLASGAFSTSYTPAWQAQESLAEPQPTLAAPIQPVDENQAVLPPREHTWANPVHEVVVESPTEAIAWAPAPTAAAPVPTPVMFGAESTVTTPLTATIPAAGPVEAVVSDPVGLGSLGKFSWAILGFLAALIATVVGLRSRRDQEEELY